MWGRQKWEKPRTFIKATKPLERLHCDLVGAIELPTPGKQYRYLLLVSDAYTQYISAKPLRTKDQATGALI